MAYKAIYPSHQDRILQGCQRSRKDTTAKLAICVGLLISAHARRRKECELVLVRWLDRPPKRCAPINRSPISGKKKQRHFEQSCVVTVPESSLPSAAKTRLSSVPKTRRRRYPRVSGASLAELYSSGRVELAFECGSLISFIFQQLFVFDWSFILDRLCGCFGRIVADASHCGICCLIGCPGAWLCALFIIMVIC
jgi:hypothetical protein